jgi:hypothetical protein
MSVTTLVNPREVAQLLRRRTSVGQQHLLYESLPCSFINCCQPAPPVDKALPNRPQDGRPIALKHAQYRRGQAIDNGPTNPDAEERRHNYGHLGRRRLLG